MSNIKYRISSTESAPASTTVKGSPLTNLEMDANIKSLNDSKAEITAPNKSVVVPSGSTGTRDTSPAAGYFRFNTTDTKFEGYDGTGWVNVSSLTGIETLTNKTLTTPDINGGTIDGTAIGSTTPASGAFTTLSASEGASISSINSLTFNGGTGYIQAGVNANANGLGNYTTFSAVTGHGFSWAINQVSAATITSTGLAVTGALSASGPVALNGSATLAANTHELQWKDSAGAAKNVLYMYADDSVYLSSPVTGSSLIFRGAGYAEHMRVDAAGNLGLGVVPSAWGGIGKTLQISTGGSLSADAANLYQANNAFYNGTNWIYSTTNSATRYTAGAGSHSWFTAPSGTAGTPITFTQAMTLSGDGNLHVPGGGGMSNNEAFGSGALLSNTTGGNNTACGNNAMLNNTVGGGNTAIGQAALYNNTTGIYNTACGNNALHDNTTGIYNTAIGQDALTSNTDGNYNTACGKDALYSNISGTGNIAIGQSSLYTNTESNNVSIGYNAMRLSTTGFNNVAIGYSVLQNNTTGTNNTACGYAALSNNTTGIANTAVGQYAMLFNTTGSGNTSIGPLDSTGGYNPVFSPISENNRFCMGSTGVTNAYVQVAWTVVSDARDKTDFAPVPHGLDFICQLQPTAYRYKMNRSAIEGHGPLRYGFKAQEVLALEGNTPVIVDAEDENKLRFNDQSMIAVMVNAIKELKAEFDAYKLTHP